MDFRDTLVLVTGRVCCNRMDCTKTLLLPGSGPPRMRDRVTKTDVGLEYRLGWSRTRVKKHCRANGWKYQERTVNE